LKTGSIYTIFKLINYNSKIAASPMSEEFKMVFTANLNLIEYTRLEYHEFAVIKKTQNKSEYVTNKKMWAYNGQSFIVF